MNQSDEVLARWYFDKWIAPGLEGMPTDGIEYLRERYVKDALANPRVREQLRHVFGEQERAMRKWDCRKKFVLQDGELSNEAYEELMDARPGYIRRTGVAGQYSFSCECEAATSGDAAMVSNRMLLELLGPYGVLFTVTDSSNTLVGEA